MNQCSIRVHRGRTGEPRDTPGLIPSLSLVGCEFRNKLSRRWVVPKRVSASHPEKTTGLNAWKTSGSCSRGLKKPGFPTGRKAVGHLGVTALEAVYLARRGRFPDRSMRGTGSLGPQPAETAPFIQSGSLGRSPTDTSTRSESHCRTRILHAHLAVLPGERILQTLSPQPP